MSATQRHRSETGDLPFEILVVPDPGGIAFNERATPMLYFIDHYPGNGGGWVLHRVRDVASGAREIDDYFIPGEVEDIDRAIEAAHAFLAERADR